MTDFLYILILSFNISTQYIKNNSCSEPINSPLVFQFIFVENKF